ncbi:MAG: tetratricopeptide repeat protein [Bacteroidota bacterium]
MKQTQAIPAHTAPNAVRNLQVVLGAIAAIFAFLLYIQSVGFKYTLDDDTVTHKNAITKQGFKGIPTLLSTDYWYGNDDSLRVPQYRPLSIVSFAVEWQFFPNRPAVYHLDNVLLYALTCLLLFNVLCMIFEKQNLLLPFIVSLLYVAHPIHTEVVDSIKSRDEILCFLFALFAIFLVMNHVSNNNPWLLIASSFSFFLSILSKETGIAYVVIVPILLFVFTPAEKRKIAIIALAFALPIIVFLIIRHIVLAGVVISSFDSPLNNSLYLAKDFISQKATAVYVLLRYVILLIIPHPLSYDYSMMTIPIQQLTDPGAFMGLAVYGFLLLYAFRNIVKKDFISFGILFYLLTLIPVSNLLIMIGSPMAERFMYMPSLGFCLVVSLLMIKFTKGDMMKRKFGTLSQMLSSNSMLFVVVFVIVGLYSVKTYARSQDWKDNHALFGHDVNIVDKSARVHFSLGTVLLVDLYPEENDKALKKKYNNDALVQFNEALKYFPNYPTANFFLGQCYMNNDDYPNAIRNFEIARQITNKPNTVLFNNLGVLYGKVGQFDKSLSMLDSAIKHDPKFAEAYSNKAFAYLNLANDKEAIAASNKAIELNPKYAKAYMNAGCAYVNQKEYDKALDYLNKSASLDSTDAETVFFIGAAYHNMGNLAKGKEFMDRSERMKADKSR